ncbi:MAG TPA: DNA-binding protein [Marinospirillum sp.]|uniref:DNA-binding protein n=1 Tax=Marinospirillum sp. TaxID=2183934 RepID=UPI002B4A50FE|nr:DNA-binding protein [Marinospirillum sp.]HKM16184.1 DNA-binding protein [Marinospirillum sp.]
MARVGIQYETVVEAVLQLQKQGDNPTIQRIREWLGTGSFTTISEHLRQWRENQKNSTPLQQEGLGLPANLIKLTQELWQQACLEADEKMQVYQQQADEKINQAIAEQQAALEAAQRTEERNLLLDKKNNELLTDLKQQAAQVSRLEAGLETSQEHLNSSKNQLISLEKIALAQEVAKNQQIVALEEKLEQQKEQQKIALTHEQQRNEENQLRWMQEVDLARQQTQSLKEVLQQETKQAKQRIQQLEENLNISQQQTQQQLLELQRLKIKEENWLKQQQQLEGQQAAYLTKLEAMKIELTNKDQEVRKLKAAVATASKNRPSPLIMV